MLKTDNSSKTANMNINKLHNWTLEDDTKLNRQMALSLILTPILTLTIN